MLIHYDSTNILHISAHIAGNKANNLEAAVSQNAIEYIAPEYHGLLLKYFLSSFKIPEYYHFAEGSTVLKSIVEIFANPDSIHEESIKLVEYLTDCTTQPNIKEGEFFLVHFDELVLEDEVMEAIGIFKCDTRDIFLQLNTSKPDFKLTWEEGINLDKLDKGCLIFNTNSDSGYKAILVDKAGRGAEAMYWKESFLNLEPLEDSYRHTANFMGLAKSFVTEQLVEEYEINGKDKSNYLQRSVDYFKNNERFDEKEFAQEVFNDSAVIDSFQRFKHDYGEEKGVEMEDGFNISTPAVQKQSKNFKSIIKLDKNFHIYIHGDRGKIDRGSDEDGRKFYKLYYEEES